MENILYVDVIVPCNDVKVSGVDLTLSSFDHIVPCLDHKFTCIDLVGSYIDAIVPVWTYCVLC